MQIFEGTEIIMSSKGSRQQAAPVPVRVSVSFPTELYRTLEQIAEQKKVSVAWVVRDAAEQYISNQWPLLSGGEVH